jgi:hypothetical protein
LALSESSVVGPRASGFLPDKDGEAGDIGSIVDAAGCSQAKNKPLEARPSFQTEPLILTDPFILLGYKVLNTIVVVKM